MEKKFKKNNAIDKNHYGGRKKYSTLSAITKIYDTLYKNDEDNYISVILATDLSSTYDLIDVEIMVSKLEHYGVRGGWNDLLLSYLSDRKQYVCLDHFNSILRNSPKCSIVQGSRISGLMFNIFCNEIPKLHKLLNTDIFFKLVSKNRLNTKNISHNIINFVDDSTNIIGFKDHEKIKPYLEQYYKLISSYYNINKLKLNNDKNKLMIINKPRLNKVLKKFSFKAGNETVTKTSKIKISGSWIQDDLKMDAEVNKLSGILHNRINNIRKISKYTDFKSRLSFMNAYVLGKLNYMLPLYNNLPGYLVRKLHKIIMTSARVIIGNYCFKKSNLYILGKVGWMDIRYMIIRRCLCFIHNVLTNKAPKCIMELYRKQRLERHRAEISLINIPKNKKYSKFFINEHTETYNNLPIEIKQKSIATFKKEIKQWIQCQPSDTFD